MNFLDKIQKEINHLEDYKTKDEGINGLIDVLEKAKEIFNNTFPLPMQFSFMNLNETECKRFAQEWTKATILMNEYLKMRDD